LRLCERIFAKMLFYRILKVVKKGAGKLYRRLKKTRRKPGYARPIILELVTNADLDTGAHADGGV